MGIQLNGCLAWHVKNPTANKSIVITLNLKIENLKATTCNSTCYAARQKNSEQTKKQKC